MWMYVSAQPPSSESVAAQQDTFALTRPFVLLELDHVGGVLPSPAMGSVPFELAGTCHGVMMWVVHDLGDSGACVSTGYAVENLQDDGRPTGKLVRYAKQAIRLFPDPVKVVASSTADHSQSCHLVYEAMLDYCGTADLQADFAIR